MHIDLSGTNFSFAKNVTWKEYGQNAVNRIFISNVSLFTFPKTSTLSKLSMYSF